MKQWREETEVGPIYFVASAEGLRGILWKQQEAPLLPKLDGSPEGVILAEAVLQVREFLQGKRRKFQLPLEFSGTPFQREVWAELCRIPYGQTISYRELAQKIRRAKAVRAVGTANGRNPLSLVIPCHRVIAADGSLGGYAGGLVVKQKLLFLEQSRL